MNHFGRLPSASRWCLLIAVLALVVAQGCDSDTTSDTQPTHDATSGDTAAPDAHADTGAPDTNGDTDSPDVGPNDPDADSAPSCPPYQTRCEGACIPTSTDPNNCGGCGVTCGESEVCSGGTCTDTCMAGLEICDQKCVDFESDNDHCGACGSACDAGEGCVAGACQPAADLGDRGEACAGGGPPIDLGETVTVERQCTGELAERTFRWAVCSCDGFSANTGIVADAYDSSTGPYVPGGEGGGLATNGIIHTNVGFEATGTVWAADALDTGTAVSTNTPATIGQRLHAGSSVQMGSGTSIGGDAYINGDVANNLSIGGILYAPDSANIDGGTTYADLQRGPVDVAQPCDACGEDARLPIAEIVAAHTSDNNNADIGLDEDIFSDDGDEARRIDLPCGEYYLSEISRNAPVTIVAHGNTALYIGGDIHSNGKVTITLTPDAQLDIFVAGSVNTNTGMTLGSPNYPALLRMYIGGDAGLHTNIGADISGYIYAVPGGINANTSMEVFGGVYGQSIHTNVGSKFHFDRLINIVGESCPDGSPDPDPDPDPDICATETDTCETSSDCCAPLVCGALGECTLLECVPAQSACTQSAECCSGACSGGFCIVG